MRIFILFIFLLCVITSHAQTAFSAKRITASQLPKNIKYRGKMNVAWTWEDSLGTNILILTHVPEYAATDPDLGEAGTAELHAYQYVKKDTGFRLLWRLNDIVKECPFDIFLEFCNGSVAITDLNRNGVAEATFVYKITCTSDVSPIGMKLIMHEDSVKYALRGMSCDPGNGPNQQPCIEQKELNLARLKKPADEWEQILQAAGRYENEADFAKAPKEFLSFARLHWRKYIADFK